MPPVHPSSTAPKRFHPFDQPNNEETPQHPEIPFFILPPLLSVPKQENSRSFPQLPQISQMEMASNPQLQLLANNFHKSPFQSSQNSTTTIPINNNSTNTEAILPTVSSSSIFTTTSSSMSSSSTSSSCTPSSSSSSTSQPISTSTPTSSILSSSILNPSLSSSLPSSSTMTATSLSTFKFSTISPSSSSSTAMLSPPTNSSKNISSQISFSTPTKYSSKASQRETFRTAPILILNSQEESNLKEDLFQHVPHKRAYKRTPLPTSGKQCSSCKTNTTPEWRSGPQGPKTLCNACGLKFAKLAKSTAKQN